MSLGDHLDELRRRMMRCLIALFVCIGAMLPFKTQVTEVYIEPYRIMWFLAYEGFLEKIESEFAARVGPPELEARRQAARYLSKEKVGEILAGGYARPQELKEVAGYGNPYPEKGDTGAWDAFVLDFTGYATAVRNQQDWLDQLSWHRERKDQIFSREFEDRGELIYTHGGFLLPYNLRSTRPLEDFWTFMAASLLFSCILASPILLWQIWAFIAAGLYQKERAVVYRTLPFAILLLVAGISFGYFVMVPYGFFFLAQLMNWALITPMFTVADYFKFLLTLTAALGLVFQLPILMVALQKVGILQFSTVAKNWRWVVFSFFVNSAMLTPPDPVTQVLMVTPMLTLFLLGLFLMWRAERKQKRAGDASPLAAASGGSA